MTQVLRCQQVECIQLTQRRSVGREKVFRSDGAEHAQPSTARTLELVLVRSLRVVTQGQDRLEDLWARPLLLLAMRHLAAASRAAALRGIISFAERGCARL
jgi:hypothetical protein